MDIFTNRKINKVLYGKEVKLMRWMKWAGIGLSILGALVGLASDWVTDKNIDALLDEKIDERVAELSKKKKS